MAAKRVVGVVGAVGIGLGSMLGAGVFVIWPAVILAGAWAVPAIVAAGLVALANALSTAQLAARYPVAGGAYAYARAELSPDWGRVAGWSFVVGKSASVAVGALVVGAGVWPEHAAWVAAAVIIVSWALNAGGITRTSAAATGVATVVILGLVAAIAAAWAHPHPEFEAASAPVALPGAAIAAAAAAFFAFAGYARIATLGEEVKDPARTIPRAILVALAGVITLYVALAVTFAARVGYGGLFTAAADGAGVARTDPIAALVEGAGVAGGPVRALAVVAGFGAVLALTAGAGRTLMAMARNRDAPPPLAVVGRSGAPWRAELVIAAAGVALVAVGGTALEALAVSVLTVLTYYAIANAAAIAQRRARRVATIGAPVWVSVFGIVGSAGLAAAVATEHSRGIVWAIAAYLLAAIVMLVRWRRRRAVDGRQQSE